MQLLFKEKRSNSNKLIEPNFYYIYAIKTNSLKSESKKQFESPERAKFNSLWQRHRRMGGFPDKP
jgi:hypothetical protein